MAKKKKNLQFSLRQFFRFKEKTIELTTVLLCSTKISEIIEYCKFNEYELEISKDHIPVISQHGKQMLIQEKNGTLYLLDKDELENGNIQAENLSDLLLFYHLFINSRDGISEEYLEFDMFGKIKKFQNFFRIQHFETLTT